MANLPGDTGPQVDPTYRFRAGMKSRSAVAQCHGDGEPFASSINFWYQKFMTILTFPNKKRGRPTVGSTSINVRMPPDELALLDRFIAEQQPGLTRPEALRLAFREWLGRAGSLDVTSKATEAQAQANAVEARSHAAGAVDEAMAGMDATKEEKAARRGALTDEPAVIVKARGKGARRPRKEP